MLREGIWLGDCFYTQSVMFIEMGVLPDLGWALEGFAEITFSLI